MSTRRGQRAAARATISRVGEGAETLDAMPAMGTQLAAVLVLAPARA